MLPWGGAGGDHRQESGARLVLLAYVDSKGSFQGRLDQNK